MRLGWKIALMSTALVLIVGCSSVLEQQTAKMDDYRSALDKEQLMSEKERQSFYDAQLWYNPNLWQVQNARKGSNAKQLKQDFFGCVSVAEEIEKNISAEIGGRDPIQTTHARATIEVCMISKKYQAIDREKKLICESEGSDVLPICDFSNDVILDYRGWG